jgi:8-oxo-dGTP pyrophosphatase MutT (NUDIX family)
VTDRFALVPASYVYLLRDGTDGAEVLLQRRGPVPYMPDHWAAAAAGHVEPGETAYDAARREAVEELGITDVSLEFAFTMQRSQFTEAIEERVDFFFTAR